MNLWLFGYGSLIWRPDIEYLERRTARVHGWTRRFWQGSHDHRGVPGPASRFVEIAPDVLVAQHDRGCVRGDGRDVVPASWMDGAVGGPFAQIALRGDDGRRAGEPAEQGAIDLVSEPAWDVYLVYAPGIHWEGKEPPRPTYFQHQLGGRLPADQRLDGPKLAEAINSAGK